MTVKCGNEAAKIYRWNNTCNSASLKALALLLFRLEFVLGRDF